MAAWFACHTHVISVALTEERISHAFDSEKVPGSSAEARFLEPAASLVGDRLSRLGRDLGSGTGRRVGSHGDRVGRRAPRYRGWSARDPGLPRCDRLRLHLHSEAEQVGGGADRSSGLSLTARV